MSNNNNYENVDGDDGNQESKGSSILLLAVGVLIVAAIVLLFLLFQSSSALSASESANISGFAVGTKLASGADGDSREDIDSDSIGVITFTSNTKAAGKYKIQDSLVNGRATYKGDNGCNIEYSLKDSAWAAICDGIALYKSYFGTESAPTNGWEGVPPIDERPKVTLGSGILVPENSGESFIVGAFVEDGFRNNRLKYVNNKGCQIYFRQNLNSTAHGGSYGEWAILCWGDHCDRWDILYKVDETLPKNIPPIKGWQAVNGLKPVPTFAVYEAIEDLEPDHADSTLASTVPPSELKVMPPNKGTAAANTAKKYNRFKMPEDERIDQII